MKTLNRDWYGLLCERGVNRQGGKIYWFVLVAFVVALNLYAPAPPTVMERFLASAIAFLAFGVIWRWTYRGGAEAELGFLPIMLVVYFLYYSLSIFTQRLFQMNYGYGNYLLEDSALEKALLLSLIGLLLIICGYHWSGRAAVAKFLPRFELRWHDKRAVEFMSVVFIGVGLVAFVVFFKTRVSGSVQAYLSLPGDLFFLSMITLFILQLEDQLNLGFKSLLWGVVIPLRIVVGLAQGMFALGMLVVMALVITYATMRRRVPWVIFIAGFAAFVVMQPVKSSLRQSVYLEGEANKEEAQTDKVAALFDSAERGWAVLQTLDLRDVVSLATERLGDILIFATLIARTPDQVPYWGGSSYYRLLFVPIPRILYPEKPNYVEGNVLGHQYEMIAADDYMTSINLPQTVELYGNFGPAGMIIGCVLLGTIYRVIHDCFMHGNSGLGAVVAGLFIFTHLLDIENSTASVFGGLLIESVEVIVFYWGIRLMEEVLKARGSKHSVRSGALELEVATPAKLWR